MCNEARQRALAANAFEEGDGLGLSAKEDLPAGRTLQTTIHQFATDTAALVHRIDEDLRNPREEVSVRQHPDVPTKRVSSHAPTLRVRASAWSFITIAVLPAGANP